MPKKQKKFNRKNSVIPYDNTDALEEFLKQPTSIIAAAIFGALAMGKRGAILAGGRLVQGAIAGKFMKQLGDEINKLIEEGKIDEEYAEKKYGFQSLFELLNFIDGEAPDIDRFNAVKAMFYALNSIDVKKSSEEILRYQLFKITISLSSSQLLILKVSYKWKNGEPSFGSSAKAWVVAMADDIGHGIDNLIVLDEKELIERQLLSPRHFPDSSGVSNRSARLTNLGIKLCQLLEEYSYESLSNGSNNKR